MKIWYRFGISEIILEAICTTYFCCKDQKMLEQQHATVSKYNRA